MWDAADRAAFIDPDLPGFAVGTKDDASTVEGLFRLASSDSFSLMDGIVASFMCAAESAPALDGYLTINSIVYRVVQLEKLNPGWVRCHLK